MRKPLAATGSAIFFVAAPCVVAGIVPWWLTQWRLQRPISEGMALRVLGAALIVPGAAALVTSFARFVIEGGGTPVPIAPTRRLVVGGWYRHVRNPMYLGVVAIILGQALLLWQPVLLIYAMAAWATMALFSSAYEEPALRARFGAQYETYRRAVPAWWPRLRPWKPDTGNENPNGK